MKFYNFMRKSLRVLMTKLIFPTVASGDLSQIPDGPVVLCANHLSASDVILLIGCTPRPISFMAKKELFSLPFIGWLLKKMQAFPVNRGAMDVSAVKKGIAILEGGGMLGIFPQGTRCPGVSPEETYGKLHAGAMMMAHRARAAILPVAIRTKNYRIRPFKKTELIYGRPILYEDYAPLVENKDYTQAVRRVFDAICALNEKGPDKE